MISRLLALLGLQLLYAFHAPASAQEIELTNDFSRGDLLEYARTLEPIEKAFPDRFKFAKDAADRPEWLFGIDVSHYNGAIDWADARNQKIMYAYVKATQGVNFFDGKFKNNWRALRDGWDNEQTRVYRGAYHFLSAQGDPTQQAEHFLRTIGKLSSTDLLPCVDLEWDAPAGTSPGAADRWKAVPASSIVRKVKTWLDVVEHATGKKPMIYTAYSWWKDRIGATDELKDYVIWIADYSSKSQLSEKPKMIPGYNYHLWQFSERGNVEHGFSTNVDVNIFKGNAQQFEAALGVTH